MNGDIAVDLECPLTRDAEPLKLHSGSSSGFLLVPVPVPAQRSKRKQIQLAYDCRLDVSQGTCTVYKLVAHGCRFNSRYRIVRKDQDEH